MYEYSADPALYEHMEFSRHRSIDETAEYVAKLRQRMVDGTAYYWFVRLRGTNKVIGSFGVHSIDWRRGTAEIGYAIAPREWGRGYFVESARVVLSHLFGSLDLYRVSATTVDRNTASKRGLERCGFTHEGVLRGYYLTYADERLDAAIYSILKPEFTDREPVHP